MCKSTYSPESNISNFTTTQECDNMIVNATGHSREDLVTLARHKKVEIRAKPYEAKSEVELACIKAVLVYEEVQSIDKGRKFRANYTWRSIKNNGAIEAAERAVTRSSVTMGYEALIKHGFEKYAFEAIILQYPDQFSAEAIEISKQRMLQWASA